MTNSERHQKAKELIGRIANAARQIEDAEKELFSLRVTDIYREEGLESSLCSLWLRLGLLQTHGLSHQSDLNRYEEDPCFASLALVEEILQTIPQSALRMQGCYIRTQDKSVRMNISISTSVEELAQMRGFYQPAARRKKM